MFVTDSVPRPVDLVRVVVEGANDIEFLRRISFMLHADDLSLPHLADMELRGALIFIPFGGGDVRSWTHRLGPLGKPEFFLLDREIPPETEFRRAAATAINLRCCCRAAVTRKRSLENYLHPEAIFAAVGVDLEFGDFDPVAEVAARHVYLRGLNPTSWELLTRRARRRMMNRAKHWLNTTAVEQMTVEMLRDRDPTGEVIAWLKTIACLAENKTG